MKKILKKIFFYCFLFNSFFIWSQVTEQQYLDTEKSRIDIVNATEVSINNYINSNLPNYNLTQAVIDEIINSLLSEGITSEVEISAVLLDVKKSELRKQYFTTFPEMADFYYATTIPEELRLTCINGGFEEQTPVAGYNFFSSSRDPNLVAQNQLINGCATLADTNPITPAINNFGSRVSLISSTAPGFLQFDPTLNTAARGFIQIPTVSPNGGNNSIKLNSSPDGGRDVTTMSRNVFIGPNDTTFDYEFSLLLQDSGAGHTLAQRPTFRVDLIVGGVVVNTRCINAQPNCIFTLSHANNTGVDQDIYYSGWRCDQIDVSGFRNQNATIVFTITDCSLSGHYGTVYIDNICGFDCPAPAFGVLTADPPNACPDLINNTPYQLCGTFSVPLNSELNNMTISVSQNGGPFTLINGAQLQVTGNNYCLSFNPNVFGLTPNGNTYQFQITANYTQTCGTLVAPVVNTTLATVTFTNCCYPTLILTSPVDNMTNIFPLATIHNERSNWINASNVIGIGNNIFQNGVVYHSGNFVDLTPGFDAINGSQFVAYIEGCTNNYVYKNISTSSSGFENINPIKTKIGFSIIPNPSSNSIDISMNGANFNKVIIASIDGKIVDNINVENKDSLYIDISYLKSGIYLVSVTADDGKIYTEKLIKR